jgi:hypothetical protein
VTDIVQEIITEVFVTLLWVVDVLSNLAYMINSSLYQPCVCYVLAEVMIPFDITLCRDHGDIIRISINPLVGPIQNLAVFEIILDSKLALLMIRERLLGCRILNLVV